MSTVSVRIHLCAARKSQGSFAGREEVTRRFKVLSWEHFTVFTFHHQKSRNFALWHWNSQSSHVFFDGGKWSPKAPNTNKHKIMQRRSLAHIWFREFHHRSPSLEVRIQTWMIKNAKTSKSIHLYPGPLRGRCSKNMATATLKDFGLSIGTIGNCKKNPCTLLSKTRAVTLTGAVAIMGCWSMGGRTWAGKYMASGCGQFLNMYVINDLPALPVFAPVY